MQIVFKENIYEKVTDLFNKNAKTYGKYMISGNRDFYIKESYDYYTDEYTTYKVDIKDIFNDIFNARGSIKVSVLDLIQKEITDGYSILREISDSMIYIDPSNMLTDLVAKMQ